MALTLADASGEPLGTVESLAMRPASTQQLRGSWSHEDLYRVSWTELAVGSETAAPLAGRVIARIAPLLGVPNTAPPRPRGKGIATERSHQAVGRRMSDFQPPQSPSRQVNGAVSRCSALAPSAWMINLFMGPLQRCKTDTAGS